MLVEWLVQASFGSRINVLGSNPFCFLTQQLPLPQVDKGIQPQQRVLCQQWEKHSRMVLLQKMNFN